MSNKAIVGITSRCSEQNAQWLMEFIKGTFRVDVKFLPITNRNTLEWEDRVRQCSVGILYHTKQHGRLNIVDIDGALYDEELKSLYRNLGKSNVLVVLDDVDDCSDREKMRILQVQPSLNNLSSQLLLFPEKGKAEEASKKMDEFRKVFGYNTQFRDPQPNANNSKDGWSFSSLFSSSSEKSDETSSASRQIQKPLLPNITSRLKINIFSRSAQSNYDWLVDSLRTMGSSIEIHGVHITNNYTGFYSEISRCSFAILYHTQKQRRLHLTDITKALYSEELRDLSTGLGKENVIVVVDDLKKTDQSEKRRILDGQLSIGRLARDLYLFSDKEKHTDSLEEIKQIIWKKITCNNMDAGKSNVLVVLDDVDDCSDREKRRILEVQPSLNNLSSQLCPEKGKTKEASKKMDEFRKVFDYNTQSRDPQPNANNSKGGWSFSSLFSLSSENSDETSSASRQNLHQRQRLPSIITSKLKINIFSRSAQSNYDWLVDSLRTMGRSIEVRGVYITNSYTGFYSEISQCSFAILYHTKKQGRLNITDVTDSLYDEELRDLSNHLGKENVIVVVDDLQKTDQSEKMRILDGQLSIGRLARDLYLFSDKEKHTDSLEEIKQIIRKKTTTCNMNTDPHVGSLQEDFDEKSKKSAKPGTNLGQECPQNREDDQPPPPGSSLTARSKERYMSSNRDITWKDDHYSGEPEVKMMSLELTRLNLQSPEAAAQVDKAFKEAYEKWQDCEKKKQKDYTIMQEEIQRLSQENKELLSKNIKLFNEMSENENVQKQILKKRNRTIEEKEHDIEMLYKELQGKGRTLKEKDAVIQEMEQTIQELKNKLREREERLTDEMKNSKEKQLTIEKLHKDLRDQDRTIEEKNAAFEKMEQENQRLQKYLQNIGNTSRQEHDGHNWKQGIQAEESQRCEERSPIPGQEDDVTHRELGGHDYHKGFNSMEESSIHYRAHSDTGAMYYSWKNPAEKQSHNPENDLIEKMKCTIQQQDEEIQKLKTQIKQKESELEDNASLVQDLLSVIERGKEKC